MLSPNPFDNSVGIGFFGHRTESDLFLFSLSIYIQYGDRFCCIDLLRKDWSHFIHQSFIKIMQFIFVIILHKTGIFK